MKDMIRIIGEILKGSVVLKHFYFPDFERYAVFIFLRNISMYIYNILCSEREGDRKNETANLAVQCVDI